MLVHNIVNNRVHETNYFLRTIKNEHYWNREVGETNIVVFTEPWISSSPQHLCVDPDDYIDMKNLEMLAHKICVANNYPTFNWIALKNISSTRFELPETSQIECSQRGDLSIDCKRSISRYVVSI